MVPKFFTNSYLIHKVVLTVRSSGDSNPKGAMPFLATDFQAEHERLKFSFFFCLNASALRLKCFMQPLICGAGVEAKCESRTSA